MSDFGETLEKFKEMIFKETNVSVAYPNSAVGESILESYVRYQEECNRIVNMAKTAFVDAVDKGLVDEDPYASDCFGIKNEGDIEESLQEGKKSEGGWSGFMQVEEEEAKENSKIPTFVMMSDISPYAMKEGEEREVEVLLDGQVVKAIAKKQSTSTPYYPVKNYKIKDLGDTGE